MTDDPHTPTVRPADPARAPRVTDRYHEIEVESLRDHRPLRAMLELTYRCNYRCAMCYLVDFRSPGELSLDEWTGVLDELADLGVLVVTLTGGEPLLRRDFFEIAERARDRRFALRIFTNGSRIDADAAARLAEVRPLSTEVSIYGANDATYRAVTGRSRDGECAQVMDAVRRLRAHDLPVQVKMPVIRQNLADVDAVHAFAEEVGAVFVANVNITPKDDGDLSPLAHALDDQQLEDYYRKYVGRRPPQELDPEGLMCNTGRNALVISPVGDVFPCIQIKRAVGNVRRRSVSEIWRGHPLLDRLRSLRVKDYAACPATRSGEKRGCGAQCAGIAHATAGSFTARDPLADRLTRIRARAESENEVGREPDPANPGR